jgi:hypothetical protein
VIRNWFNRRIKIDKKLVERYRNDLLMGIAVCPESEKPLYRIHIETLENVERCVMNEESIEDITSQIRKGRRDHGWSYLSGKEGEVATNSAHNLLTNLEKQIFKMKGEDWYRTYEHRRHST